MKDLVWTVSLADSSAGLQAAANLATAIGVLIAVLAALVAGASLRSQAKSQQLDAILTTNTLWQEVGLATTDAVTLSASTVEAVQRVYAELSGGLVPSALNVSSPVHDLELRVPFVVGGLLPTGAQDRATAPDREESYLLEMRARTVALGYVRSVLEDAHHPPAWLSVSARVGVARDFAALDSAMVNWVNRMNEVAELYEGRLVDRRRFVGKRSVSIVQQMFVAEPYILWRNSTTPGRWGLRVLGLGAEARLYHWRSPLQRAAIRLQGKHPIGFEPSQGYPGFFSALGWIVGPGRTRTSRLALWRSEFIIRRGLGAGYRSSNKSRQNDLIRTLPSSPDSGLEPGPFTWTQLLADPTQACEAVTLLRRL